MILRGRTPDHKLPTLDLRLDTRSSKGLRSDNEPHIHGLRLVTGPTRVHPEGPGTTEVRGLKSEVCDSLSQVLGL